MTVSQWILQIVKISIRAPVALGCKVTLQYIVTNHAYNCSQMIYLQTENPSEMLMKAALMLLLLYPAAQVLWLGCDVGLSSCGLQCACRTVKEGLYGLLVQHAVCVPAVSSQFCMKVLY